MPHVEQSNEIVDIMIDAVRYAGILNEKSITKNKHTHKLWN